MSMAIGRNEAAGSGNRIAAAGTVRREGEALRRRPLLGSPVAPYQDPTERVGQDDPGLPAPLPEGESILWRGGPDPWLMACRVFHIRAVALYFTVLAIGSGVGVLADGGGLAAAAGTAARTLPFAALGLALLMGLGWLTARSTIYTITRKRIVIRTGAVLWTKTNLPLRTLRTLDIKRYGGGGDLRLTLNPGEHIGWWVLWPNVRPFTFGRTEPLLRCLREPERVGRILADALAAEAARPSVPATAPPPVQGVWVHS